MSNIKKLHLGSGEIYLPGYINIDFPIDSQTVIKTKAHKYADIITLKYPENSIDEIRLHHVFEHFDRPTALALLCNWRTWLKPEGLLRIETPDAMSCFRMLSSPFLSYDDKQQVERHLFGSHEASWAVHWDGWYKERYANILPSLGFSNIRFSYNKWGLLRNIEVFAYKNSDKFTFNKFRAHTRKILMESTIRAISDQSGKPVGSEKEMLNVWIKKWESLTKLKRNNYGH